jgi:hypothetical protein
MALLPLLFVFWMQFRGRRNAARVVIVLDHDPIG